ncbi:tRNA 2-thiouridine(34) synthase MnmA [Desulfovibrio mangrovi]|uniref:tRNA 2-thiouridine(34) synthase MnmA n=1 Tax=Desulfovibrio mangrovi TaxID=2976983 RepID=UPI002245F10A|nr:tRNA 2-thiouridine(34) synthase MnmA [Desulfovibrio mangrovi]UZP65874.1 tRNA 2-thiouridine(34) synthase MnmA [Desulfovibrio mangrovi]
MTTAVAISGGTDSMFALLTLKEQGHDVFALHAHFLPRSTEREEALASMCRQLDVPFHAVDLHEEFERCVVAPFLDEYARSRTPNPCALCNARMKFGALWREAEKLGASRIATGHYAVLHDHPKYGRVLSRGHDPNKDQSYFLSLVPAASLARAVFPLGELTKDAVKAELARRGLTPPYPSESQEICFVPDDDYRAFLRSRATSLRGAGPIVTTAGEKVGTHAGLWQYTEGQRKGLGIAWRAPLYVVGKDARNNTLIVGEKEKLTSEGCTAAHVNLLVPHELWPEDLLVRIRYRQQPLKAAVSLETDRDNGTHSVTVRFETPRTPPAAGQVCCIYDAEQNVLGGGIIENAL